MSEDVLSKLVGMLPKIPAFFEFKLKGSFVISDTLIPAKWNKDSVDTFSLIIFTRGWSMNFSRAILTGFPKAVVFGTKYSRVEQVKFVEGSL